MRRLDSITDSVDMSLSNSGRCCSPEEPGVLLSMGRKESDSVGN